MKRKAKIRIDSDRGSFEAPAAIVFIVPAFPGRGTELAVLNTAAALDRSLFAPVVVVPREGVLTEACAREEIPHFCFPELASATLRRPLSWLRGAGRFAAFLKQHGAAVIDATFDKSLNPLLIWYAAKRAKVKVIVRNRAVAPYLDPVSRFAVSRADAVVSNSRFTLRDWLLPRTSDFFLKLAYEKIHVIRDGRELSRYASLVRNPETLWSLGVPAGARVVGMAGTVTHNTRQDRFLEMAAEIRRRDSHVWFLIIGGNAAGSLTDYEQDLREQVFRLGLADRVIFTGFREDIAGLLKCLDVLIFLSERTGLPPVLVEARAAGIPSVAMDVGGALEIVEHGKTGFLLPEWHAGEFAARTLQLLRDNDLHDRMSLASMRGLESFDVETTLSQEIRLYCSLTGIPVLQIEKPVTPGSLAIGFAEAGAASKNI